MDTAKKSKKLTIEDRVTNVIQSWAEKNEENTDLKPNDNIVDKYNFDSLNVVELTIGLEEEFDIKIEDLDQLYKPQKGPYGISNRPTHASIESIKNYISKRVKSETP